MTAPSRVTPHPTTSHQLPKSPSQGPMSPPPPYRPRPSAQILGLGELTNHGIQMAQASPRAAAAGPNAAIVIQDTSGNLLSRPLHTTLLSGHADPVACGDDEDGEGTLSPISLRITTAVNVTKDNNLVCLSDTPSVHAGAISDAVVAALRQGSSGQCGIPMIDEEGRPRPIRIEVDAGLNVEGSGNVLGSEAVINQVVRQRAAQFTGRYSPPGEFPGGQFPRTRAFPAQPDAQYLTINPCYHPHTCSVPIETPVINGARRQRDEADENGDGGPDSPSKRRRSE